MKEALKAGRPQIGTWLSIGDFFATRFMARAGFDFLTVDLEHTPTDWHRAAQLLATISETGCVPLARVPDGTHDHIKRALDAGAHGIICPMVNTVEQARKCIEAAKFPPQGTRSVGGAHHAINFGTTAPDYYREANNEILVILQTESPEGVDNAEEIYSLPGVDGIFVGPNDLRAQMRSADGRDPSPEEFQAMLNRILAAGQKTGTPVGIHVRTTNDVTQFVEQGWQIMAIGSELSMMLSEAQRIVSIVKPGTSTGELARY